MSSKKLLELKPIQKQKTAKREKKKELPYPIYLEMDEQIEFFADILIDQFLKLSNEEK